MTAVETAVETTVETTVETKEQIFFMIKCINSMDKEILKTMQDFIKAAENPDRSKIPEGHFDRFTIACAEEIMARYKKIENHSLGNKLSFEWACKMMGMKEDFYEYS